MTYHVFISHSSKDKVLADAMCAVLEANGVRCWIAPRDILPSESWAVAILRGISQSKMMVLIFSANANGSQHVHREVERAVAHAMPVLPVRVEDVLPAAELEYFLSSAHWLNAIKPPFEQHLRDLSVTVRAVLESKGASLGPAPTLVTPRKSPAADSAFDADRGTSPRPQVAPAPAKPRGKMVVLVSVVLFLGLAAGGTWLALNKLKSGHPAGPSVASATPAPPATPKTLPSAASSVNVQNPLEAAAPTQNPLSPGPGGISQRPAATTTSPAASPTSQPLPLRGNTTLVQATTPAGMPEPSYVSSPVAPTSATDDAAQRLAAEKAETERIANQRVAAQRAAQISQLLDLARSNDSPEKGKDALQTLNQVLTLDPQNAEALRLKDKISAYYAPTLTNSLKMLLVRIEPGDFLMGTPATETGHAIDETQHRVKITKAYLLGAYPVTQSQWSALMTDNPSKFKGNDLPVECVSWDDAVQFCEKLSAREQKHYHLPTEAQWEYACRAGTTTPFYCGQTITSDLANYDARTAYANGLKGESRMKTTPVGIFKPNAWGLFDMCGNVNEWCSDWYSPYPTGDVVDPTGPDTAPPTASWRVLRGGSWGSTPIQCRSGARYKSAPGNHFNFYGLRVALDVG